jgi:hypothetical protein
MLKRAVSLLMAVMIISTPCIALASHHHNNYRRPKYHRTYRHRHHSRSMHRGDYAAVAAAVILGAILADRM